MTIGARRRANLVRKVKALLSKTVENGATEAEAMAFLAKAQELMLAHGLDEAAIEAGHGVAIFTGTWAWMGEAKSITFAGRESDAIFADWLIDALDGFVNRAALSYLADAGAARVRDAKRVTRVWGQGDMFGALGGAVSQYQPESDRVREDRMWSFSIGVCARISQRLSEMADADALKRHEAAKAQLERQGMKFQKSRSGRANIRDHAAFSAGVAAGNNAAFNKPMGGSRAPSATLQIGA